MEDLSPGAVVTRFIACLNNRALAGMKAHVSQEMALPDIRGGVYHEPGFMENYLDQFPRYKILADRILEGAQGAAVIGRTSGSHVHPEVEAGEILVWTTEVRKGLITSWRIYAGDAYSGRR